MSEQDLESIDIGLMYIDAFPEEYFDDFRNSVDRNRLVFEELPRENVPYMAVEWMIPTAVAIYIGIKFIDAIIERTADDFVDVVYPKIKSGISQLVEKVLIQDRSKFALVSSGKNKLANPTAIIFSVYAVAKTGQQLKFIFHDELSADECNTRIEELFSILVDHYSNDGNEDRLSKGMEKTAVRSSGPVLLLYNTENVHWEVVDVMAEIARRQSTKDDK